MFKLISPIVFIYLCTSAAWVVLASMVELRTESYDRKLRESVEELWGTMQKQESPALEHAEGADKSDSVSLQAAEVAVDLNLEHHQKGLLWYPTYRVKFKGKYQITNFSEMPKSVIFKFKFPTERAIYDDVEFLADGQVVPDLPLHMGVVTRTLSLPPGGSESVEIRYATAGIDAWWYDFGSQIGHMKNFSLAMTTNFSDIDFPEHSIAPTSRAKTPNGWRLQWTYTNLISSLKIGMVMPHKLNPGPWVCRVIYAAPISLFLFFFVLFILSMCRGIRIHPINYFFIGASFFSFHLLLAYLVDHVSVHLAFAISSIVSIGLAVSYMYFVVGQRFAFVEIGISQFVFLVLFSCSFFFQGYTGLTITIMCIAVLFVTMQITARLDWNALLSSEGADEEIRP